jgi:hypothetical protein
MLHRHEKLCFQKKQTRVEHFLATAIMRIPCSSFRWFASTIQMYSRLCLWLLTWSDYEENYEEDDGGMTMTVQTRIHLPVSLL